jgi:hypothetical protein
MGRRTPHIGRHGQEHSHTIIARAPAITRAPARFAVFYIRIYLWRQNVKTTGRCARHRTRAEEPSCLDAGALQPSAQRLTNTTHEWPQPGAHHLDIPQGTPPELNLGFDCVDIPEFAGIHILFPLAPQTNRQPDMRNKQVIDLQQQFVYFVKISASSKFNSEASLTQIK